MNKTPLALLGALALAVACQSTDPETGTLNAGYSGPVPAPLTLAGKAYDAALLRELPAEAPEEHAGLHNVFRLSDDIISGGEPDGPEGLESIAAMGVRTILSVDGKAPDVQTAAALGMRYVHVPVQYSDLTRDQLLKIAKTFRELEGPFYVHCYHGKHRGPAGAAVGRVVLDGAGRDQAIAEMRQWCGTSKKYEGLYRRVAIGALPSAEETAAFAWDFPGVDAPEGMVGVMVELGRLKDHLALARDSGWNAPDVHPDLNALREAELMRDAFVSGLEDEGVRTAEQDFLGWYDTAVKESAGLVDALERFQGGEAAAADEASLHFAAIAASCSDCHLAYRN